MKLLKTICITLALTLLLSTSAFASDMFSVKTALNMPASYNSCGISVAAGKILEFSAQDLERRLGLTASSLGGITVMALPKESQGALVLDGVDVEAYDFIDRDAVDRLCFVPSENAVAASLTFIPKAAGAVATELTIEVLSKPNLSPDIQGGTYRTARNVGISGMIDAVDPDGDGIAIRVLKPPVNGTVTFDGVSFFYTPYKNVSGKDSFTVCAVDSFYNYSHEAVIDIQIEKPKSSFYYADMTNNPSAYAAIKLHENKVVTGKQIGGSFFFFPDEQTTRGEFLVMVIAASGLEKTVSPAVNTGLSNDVSIPSWLKPYVKKAVDENIWPKSDPFVYDQIPTRAEAVVMTGRAAKINDVKDFTLQMPDQYDIPSWALRSYKELAAYKMLDLYGGLARPNGALTNSYSADLVWQLWKHTHR